MKHHQVMLTVASSAVVRVVETARALRVQILVLLLLTLDRSYRYRAKPSIASSKFRNLLASIIEMDFAG